MSKGNRRPRTSITYKQFMILCAEFNENLFPNREQRSKIGKMADLDEKRVQFWFQNQRRRLKKSSKTFRNLDLLADYVIKNFNK